MSKYYGKTNAIVSSGGGGEVSLNIAYGLTPPSDTTKIWARANITPLKEEKTYYVPFTKNINTLETEVLITDDRLALATPLLFSYKTYIYIIGGNSNGNSVNTIYRYNIETNNLELLNITFPTIIARAKPIVIGDYAYIIGGYYLNNNTAYNLYSIYKMDLKTLDITLEITNSSYITAEIYDIFKYDNEYIIWNMPTSNYVIKYNITSKTIQLIGSKSSQNGINFSCQNKYINSSCYGYLGLYYSLDILSLSLPMGQASKTYDLVSMRYGLGAFAIGTNMYAVGGIKGSSWYGKIEKINLETATITELTNDIDASGYICRNYNENIGIGFISKKIYLFKDNFELLNNNVLIETDREGNYINCYIGDVNNKAQLIYLYKYDNGTWKGINCQDYSA